MQAANSKQGAQTLQVVLGEGAATKQVVDARLDGRDVGTAHLGVANSGDKFGTGNQYGWGCQCLGADGLVDRAHQQGVPERHVVGAGLGWCGVDRVARLVRGDHLRRPERSGDGLHLGRLAGHVVTGDAAVAVVRLADLDAIALDDIGAAAVEDRVRRDDFDLVLGAFSDGHDRAYQ